MITVESVNGCTVYRATVGAESKNCTTMTEAIIFCHDNGGPCPKVGWV
jgi:hypothetical protein